MILKLHELLVVGFLLSCLGCEKSAATGITASNCTHLFDDIDANVTAYVDWEFKLNCDSLKSSWASVFGGSNATSQVQCFVKGYGANFTSASAAIRLSGYAPKQSTYILFLISGNQCVTKNVTVHVNEIPVTSCAENLADHLHRDVNVHHVEVVDNGNLQLDCMPANPSGSDYIPPPAVSAASYVTQWYYVARNESGHLLSACKKLENVSNRFQLTATTHPDRPTSVLRTNFQYHHTGVFSCAVRYRNHTVYVTHYSVCVKREKKSEKPTVACSDKLFFEGEQVNIACNVGTIRANGLKIKWRKVNAPSDLCINNNYSIPSKSSTDQRVSCQVENAQDRSVCYGHVVSLQHVANAESAYQPDLLLTIRNVRKEDAGLYEVHVVNGNHSSNATFQLQFNPEEELRRLGIGLGVTLTFLVIALFLSGFVWLNRVYVKLWWRRHFGDYDADNNKLYVANLTYFYSSDMHDDSREAVKHIIGMVKKKLEDLEYNYFDHYEEYSQGFQVSTLLRSLDQSHRMIIILTQEFVNTKWSRFVAEQGFQNMLENSTKLIFIRTPKSKKALRELAEKHDNFTKKLNKAMKTCRNIRYNPSGNESRFLADVEYALPNLKHRKMGDVTDASFADAANESKHGKTFKFNDQHSATLMEDKPTVMYSEIC